MAAGLAEPFAGKSDAATAPRGSGPVRPAGRLGTFASALLGSFHPALTYERSRGGSAVLANEKGFRRVDAVLYNA